MVDYKVKYKQLLINQGLNLLEQSGVLFREYNQIIIPRGPIKVEKPGEINAREIFKKLNGKLLWWSYFDADLNNSEWYGVVKYNHTEISDYQSSNFRNQLKKGLKNFAIRKVDAEYLIENGIEVFEKVHQQYYSTKPDCNLFIKKMKANALSTDIIELWGVFKDDILIGYCEINIYDKLEANISEIKILQQYNREYASYALIHTLSEEYLQARAFSYLSDGYRTMSHESGIQDFLIRKFTFSKMPLQLLVVLKWPYNIIFKLLFPFRSLPFWPKSIKAVFNLLAIANQKI